VQSKEYDRGIAICGTGMGVSIICNKHKGVYAALCESVYQAWRSKVVNNTNVLCMGGFIIGNEMGRVMAREWLEAEYMVGLDEEMAKIVGKEFQELVKSEDELFG
jgi:ribose 5-phosphate isomerase B